MELPVLSVQMVVAVPMVSAAPRCRTRLLSFSIRVTLYARAMVTASGSPSGIATTYKEVQKKRVTDAHFCIALRLNNFKLTGCLRHQ